MLVLVVGLVIFLGVHSVSIVAPAWRTATVARLGELLESPEDPGWAFASELSRALILAASGGGEADHHFAAALALARSAAEPTDIVAAAASYADYVALRDVDALPFHRLSTARSTVRGFIAHCGSALQICDNAGGLHSVAIPFSVTRTAARTTLCRRWQRCGRPLPA